MSTSPNPNILGFGDDNGQNGQTGGNVQEDQRPDFRCWLLENGYVEESTVFPLSNGYNRCGIPGPEQPQGGQNGDGGQGGGGGQFPMPGGGGGQGVPPMPGGGGGQTPSFQPPGGGGAPSDPQSAGVTQWLRTIAQYLVSNPDIWSSLLRLVQTQGNVETPISPNCARLIAEETLTEPYKQALDQFLCGLDSPVGLGKKAERIFATLKIAASGHNPAELEANKCGGGCGCC